jgi:hypothetical protein
MPQWLARGMLVKAANSFHVTADRLIPLQISQPSASSDLSSNDAAAAAAAVAGSFEGIRRACPEDTFREFMAVQGLGVALPDQAQLAAVCSQKLAEGRSDSDSTEELSNSRAAATAAYSGETEQAQSCMQRSQVSSNILQLHEQQLLQQLQQPGQLQWAAVLAGSSCEAQLKAQRKAAHYGDTQQKQLLHWLERHCWVQRQQARCRRHELLPGCQRRSRRVQNAAAADANTPVFPAVLVYPNWSLLQPRAPPGSCKEYKAFPALALQQPGDYTAAGADRHTDAAGIGSDESQVDVNAGHKDVMWSALERAQLQWFPQAVAWMSRNETIKQLVV